MSYRVLFCAFLALALLPFAPRSASAEPGLSQDNPSVATLLPGWMREDGLYVAAIEIRLAEGWKTYWREPGSTGIPPQFDWSRSDNVAQIGYFWPAPHVFNDYDQRTIGYKDRLVLPVLLRPKRADAPIVARIAADYGVCEDVCVLRHDDPTASLHSDEIHNQALINEWIDRRATPAPEAGLNTARCNLSPANENFVLQSDLAFDPAPAAPRAVVIETDQENIWISEPDHRFEGNSLQLEADLQNYADGPLMLDRSALRITLIGDGTAIDIRGCE